ncbi:MAG: four helix bundle protein [Gemmatimonadota bacterium]|nr:four helix bundle protein [Gemmatimonadota bacterium]
MAAAIRDLKLWQEAVALAGEVIRALRATNRREVKAVVEQVMSTAVAVATHITDGYARYDAGEQHELYTAAKRELLRLETQLALARRADLLSAASDAELATRAQSVARLLVGYLAYLDRQISDRQAGPTIAAPARVGEGK